ncbi:MAG: type III pantothenate kinase [Candidatus Omnitrophota bacterium]
MLLAIDIGNSNILFGIFEKDKLLHEYKVPTDIVNSYAKCNSVMYDLSHRQKVDKIIISSVVPDALTKLNRILRRIFKCGTYVLGHDIKAPIKNLYHKPKQVGQDRLVNGVAVAALYNKSKKTPVVVIDFGTAVTFDLISKENEYMGGLIFPGIKLSLESLTRRAALLPKVTLKEPSCIIGRDTKDSMRSGILHGYASLCDGVVGRIGAKYGKRLKVVATGGDAPLIARYASSIDEVDLDLTLKGLKIIAESI